jgi:acetyltransferase-like isoleucine patch superfamily enzyme
MKNHENLKIVFSKVKSRLHEFFFRGFCNFIINLLPNNTFFAKIRPYLARLFGLKCGRKVILRKGIYYTKFKNIQIGYNSHIGWGVIFDSAGKITIGKNVGIGFNTAILTGYHSGTNPDCRLEGGENNPVNIEDGVWIAANAIIGPGVTLGAGCIVSAGSVVMRSMPAHTLIAGNPARVIKKLEEKGLV